MLVEATRLDRKTVLRCITALEKAGYITDTGERKGTTKQVRVFRVNHPVESPNDTENGTVKRSQISHETIPFFPPNDTVFPPKRSQKRDTEPVTNPSLTRKEPARPRIFSERDEMENLLQGHKYCLSQTPPDDKAQRRSHQDAIADLEAKLHAMDNK